MFKIFITFLLIFKLIIVFSSNTTFSMNLTFFKGSFDKTTFICLLDKFDASESKKYAAKWLHIEKKMIHTLHKQSANFKNIPTEFLIEKKYSGKIVASNKKNVIWTYEKNTNFKSPRQVMHSKKIKIKNIYQHSSKKYFVEISAGRWNLVSASGSCEMNNKVSPDIQKVAESKSQDTKKNLSFKPRKDLVVFKGKNQKIIYFDFEKDLIYIRHNRLENLYNVFETGPNSKKYPNPKGSYSLVINTKKWDSSYKLDWKISRRTETVKTPGGKKFLKIQVNNFGNLKHQISKSSSKKFLNIAFSENEKNNKKECPSVSRSCAGANIAHAFYLNHNSHVYNFSKFKKQLANYDVQKRIDQQKLAEEKAKKVAEIKAQLEKEKAKKLAQAEAKKIAKEKARKAREEIKLAEEKLRLEKEQQRINKEKAKKERARKLAETKAKKNAEEKARKEDEKAKKLAEQQAIKIAEEKLKKEKARKIAKEKAKLLRNKINSVKKMANDFYNDINDFVKSGGDIDLLELTKLFELKPDPKKTWTKKDLTNLDNLKNFMRSIVEFNVFEEGKIAERKLSLEKKKDKIISSLNNNLDKLNSLLRENFSIKEFAQPIQKNIKKIQDFLNNLDKNFVLKKATNLLDESSKAINIISNKIKNIKKLDDDLNRFNEELNLVLRNNFGTSKAKSASKLITKIKNVKTTLEKEKLNNKIKIFLKTGKLIEEKEVEIQKNKKVKTNNTKKKNTKSSSSSKNKKTYKIIPDDINLVASLYEPYMFAKELCEKAINLSEMKSLLKETIEMYFDSKKIPKNIREKIKNKAWDSAYASFSKNPDYNYVLNIYSSLSISQKRQACPKAIGQPMQILRMTHDRVKRLIKPKVKTRRDL